MLISDGHLCLSVEYYQMLIEDELCEEHLGKPEEREQSLAIPLFLLNDFDIEIDIIIYNQSIFYLFSFCSLSKNSFNLQVCINEIAIAVFFLFHINWRFLYNLM